MKEQKNLNLNQLLKLFCCVMTKNGETKFNRDRLMKTMYDYKNIEGFDCLLHDLTYSSYDSGLYCRQLDKSILVFKLCGLLYHRGIETNDTINISSLLNEDNLNGKYLKYTPMMEEIVSSYLEKNKTLYKASNY